MLFLKHTFLLVILAMGIGWPSVAAAQSTDGAVREITLQPGDVIRVAIWREEDLSGEFRVDENGTVTFPLLGERSVVGIPFSVLRSDLTDEYRVHLRNPSIMLTPLRRINVLGEVNQPGLYNVDPTVTLAGVVALAGGANQVGDINRIRIVRDGSTVQERASATSTVNAMDIRSGDQILIDRRGWFERNSTFVVSALLSVTSIVISLAR
jgi:polysaccharide biosynthesis/export protein